MPKQRSFLLVMLVSLFYVQAGFAQKLITSRELSKWLDNKNPPIVIDVRGRQNYRIATIPGALDGGLEPLGFLPDSSRDPIVLILNNNETQSFIQSWVKRLQNSDHPVWVLENGFSSWVEFGGAIEKPEVSYTKPGTVPFLIPRGLCEAWAPAQVFE